MGRVHTSNKVVSLEVCEASQQDVWSRLDVLAGKCSSQPAGQGQNSRKILEVCKHSEYELYCQRQLHDECSHSLASNM